MTNILVLHASLRPLQVSITRQLTALLLGQLARSAPGTVVVERDLAAEAPPHVGADLLGGVSKSANARSPTEAAAVALSSEMIDQLLWAEALVIGAPMYNFGLPSVLKTWIDNVSIAGRTFRYEPDGTARGLVTGRRAYVVTSRGGDYGIGAPETGNFADTHLRVALGLLGIADVQVVAANAQALAPEARRNGFDLASLRIAELTAA